MGALGDLPPNQQRDSFLDALRPHLSGEALEAVEAWAQERVVEGDREALGLPRRLTVIEEAMDKVLPRVEAVENSQPDNAYRRKVKDGHHHEQTIEGMDDQASAGFGYQLDATEGIDLTRGSWPNNLRLTLSGAGSVGPFCFDYLVQPGWTGTEGKEFTFQDSTSSFIIYSTAQGAVTAAIAAASTSGERTIMVCSSLTEGEIDIGGLGTSASLIITSVDRYRVVITGGANEDLVDQDSNGGNIGGRLVFRNIGLAPATSKAVLDINTDDEVLVLAFENCDFPADPGRAYLVRQDGGDRLQNIKLRVKHCTGALAGFYQVVGNGVTYSPDSLEAFGNVLGLTAVWDGGAANAAPALSTRVQGGFYTITNGITTMADGPDEFHWADLLINFGGNEALFTSPAASDTGNDWSFRNIVLRTTHVDGTFLKLEGGTAQAPHDNIYIHGIFGYSTVSPTGIFIEVDLDLTNVHVSDIHAPEWATEYTGPPMVPSPEIPQLDFFNGSILETTRIAVTSDGATVTLALDQSGGGDLTLVFSDGFTVFDTTPAVTVSLTAGSDTSPQTNYVYILQSNKTLTVSTSNWPSEEHAPVAIVILQSAATTQTENALVVHVWHDHIQGSDDQGHASHIGRWLRHRPAGWDSGVAQTLTITTNAGVPDEVDFATTAGVVFQLHRHTVPAFDTGTGTNVHVVNDSVSPYTTVNDLADLLTDSAGGSMSGRYFNLVIWASVSEETGETHLFVNLPSGSYKKQGDAIADVSGYTDFNIPRDFRGTGFLISLLTLRHQAASGGTWTSIQEIDLRGTFPNTVAGGGTSAITTEFADNAFKLFDEGDVTKVLAFEVSGVSVSTTRTLTAPDASGTLVLSEENESISGLWNFTASGVGGLGDYDLTVGDVATPDYGIIGIGDALVGRTSYNVGSLDLDGAFIFRNMGGPVTGQIEFVFTESGGSAIRFALAKAGVGNATYNPRSMLLAGPAVNDDDVVTVGYWQTNNGIFHNLACDTSGTGADLGVQNDLEVEGDIFTDSIKESTPGAGVTIEDVTVKGANIGDFDFGVKALTIEIGDGDFEMALAAGIAAFQFDNGDGIIFTRATNSFDFLIGGAGAIAITAAGLAVDAIAELTVGEGVTVDGLLIKDGAIAKYGPHAYYIPLGMDISGAPITP